MTWVALFGQLNFLLGLLAMEAAVCIQHPRRRNALLKWMLCTALMVWLSVAGNANWQFENRMLTMQVILSSEPARVMIAAASAVQMWLCYEIGTWDAIGLLTISLCCQKMQFALYKIIETVLGMVIPGMITQEGSVLLNVFILLVFCGTIWALFRKNKWHLHIPKYNRIVIVVTLVILLLTEGINIYLYSHDPQANYGGVLVAGRIQSLLLNFVTLYMMYNLLGRRTLKMEQEAMDALLEQRSTQYAFSQELINSINIKSHDLKKQIRYLKANSADSEDLIAGLENSISGYDSVIRTENETLSTVLSEKSLVCRQREIPFSCMADGTGMTFMKPLDIYTLFANLMDNAIEASSVPGLKQRGIDLIIKQQAGFLSIHEENYCMGELTMIDGLPKTSKADELYHGFGTRSMRQIIEQYDGTMQFKTENGIFCVNILIPLP